MRIHKSPRERWDDITEDTIMTTTSAASGSRAPITFDLSSAALHDRIVELEAHKKTVTAPPEGKLDLWLSTWLGSSWRTTISGVLTAGCGVVVAVDHFVPNPVLHTIAGVCTAMGLVTGGVVGLAAKDKRVYANHVVPKRHQRSRSWGRR